MRWRLGGFTLAEKHGRKSKPSTQGASTKGDQMQSEKHMVQILVSPCKDCYKNRKHAVIYSRGKKPQMEQGVQKSQYVVANTIYI